MVRARVYPWGIAEVDNPDHSDFTRLRGAILGYFYYICLYVCAVSYYLHFPGHT